MSKRANKANRAAAGPAPSPPAPPVSSLETADKLRPEHGYEWKAALFSFNDAARAANEAQRRAEDLQTKLARVAARFVDMYKLPPTTTINWDDDQFRLTRVPVETAPTPAKPKKKRK